MCVQAGRIRGPSLCHDVNLIRRHRSYLNPHPISFLFNEASQIAYDSILLLQIEARIFQNESQKL
jgi:hypothetical protein